MSDPSAPSEGEVGRPSASSRRGAASLLDRVGFEHTHGARAALTVIAWAAVLAWYVGWLVADLGLRGPAFLIALAVAWYLLYAQPTRRAMTVRGLAALAVLLAVTPVFLDLPFLLAASRYGVATPWAFVARAADLVMLVVFLLLAAIPAGIARRLARRPTE